MISPEIEKQRARIAAQKVKYFSGDRKNNIPKETLSSLFGMTNLKLKAGIAIKACQNSDRIIFPHTLLSGLGGCGKTALARAISNELNYHFVEVLGAVFKKAEDITEALQRYSVQTKASGKTLLLFIDEVHQLHVRLQEVILFILIKVGVLMEFVQALQFLMQELT